MVTEPSMICSNVAFIQNYLKKNLSKLKSDTDLKKQNNLQKNRNVYSNIIIKIKINNMFHTTFFKMFIFVRASK
jgi:hypothetical protein